MEVIELVSLQSALCCLAFFFAGVVDSITGGGGLITIPTMLAVVIPVHYITGTNQCASWLGTGVAAYEYARSGNIHLKSALITLPFAMLGSYIGARLNLMVPDRYLKIFMLITVPVIAAAFILANKKLGEEDHIDEKPPLSIVLWSALIGLVSGLLWSRLRDVLYAGLRGMPETESGAGYGKHAIRHRNRLNHIRFHLCGIRRGALEACYCCHVF